ncbi:MAG: ribosome biogenesis GTPase YlqF [Clostridia bacterium]|nr:ribosome biogenesis GTPase YlqF [Clostridia bacterium]
MIANYFPGHMAKTKREIIENLKLIDVVVEVLDARIPISSHNPDLDNIIKNKKRIVLLNKSDLAQENDTKKWVDYYKKNNVTAVIVDANSGKGIDLSIKAIKDIMKEKLEQEAAKGKIGKSIRIMIIGIPNVGKSSYINRATKKISAKVGNKPGVTVQKQWIKLDKQIEMLDTPGVLWPKFQNDEIALNLAFTGTIKDDVIERTEVVYELLKKLSTAYKQDLIDRYNLNESDINNNIAELMELIGQKRGALVSGGKVDLEKTARIILEDFRTGKLGRITLEKVK